MSQSLQTKSVHVPWIRAQKGVAPLAMLTAYDYPSALILDEAGVDLLLVGDSVGTVLYGASNTLSVTMEDILRHTQAVARAAQRAFVIADMPFMSYQVSPEQAVTNAGRMLQEGGAQAIKLEGGIEIAPTVKRICQAGIPVMGHIGLTPQSIHALGTYRMHGKEDEEKRYLIESAQALESAGAFAVVLECIEPGLSEQITQAIHIPTIGIGSGPHCDGQVLVLHDLVGLTRGKVPKFVAPTAQLGDALLTAVRAYVERVKN